MKKYILLISACVLAVLFGCRQVNEPGHFVLAYVTSGGTSMPDTRLVTHINYAFGEVNKSFNGIEIHNEARLHQIADLKRSAPHLKILLSVGGWGSGRFSEMAADEKNRLAFAKDCKRVMDEFDIDGVDLDWEYPTCNGAGISASPDDTDNFTLLMRDIRQAIGKDALLTLASVASGLYIDFKAILPYIDFVNIMTYDISRPPYHHASLYRSEMSGGICGEEAVMAHMDKGMPADKLLLGVSFYGRGNKSVPNFINYSDILTLKGYETCWDSVACCPFLRDKDGDMVCSFDNPASISVKCDFIRKHNLKGIMYWQYDGDDDAGSLRKAAFDGLQ